jgi:Ni,Fe-hydrogenase maturation factor
VIVVHQLLPELADELAVGQRVVFVDAAASTALVAARVIEPASRESCLGHACDPASLLGLTAALHSVCPRAWLVTVPAHDLGHGEGLSKETESAAEATVLLIERLVEGHE